jgi:hypothetical protein
MVWPHLGSLPWSPCPRNFKSGLRFALSRQFAVAGKQTCPPWPRTPACVKTSAQVAAFGAVGEGIIMLLHSRR